MSDDDLGEVWARSLADLADMQIEPHQRAWLQLTRPLGLVENTALIAAPNEFVKEQLETRLRALITNALSRELARSIQLAVTVDPSATADLGRPAVQPADRIRPGEIGTNGDLLADSHYGNGASSQLDLDQPAAGLRGGLTPFPSQIGPMVTDRTDESLTDHDISGLDLASQDLGTDQP